MPVVFNFPTTWRIVEASPAMSSCAEERTAGKSGARIRQSAGGPKELRHYRYNEFRRHVLDRLRNDDVANTAKSDQLIQQFGQSLFDKWGPIPCCRDMSTYAAALPFVDRDQQPA